MTHRPTRLWESEEAQRTFSHILWSFISLETPTTKQHHKEEKSTETVFPLIQGYARTFTFIF